jgi:histidinol-phosphate aminotransferase
MNRVEHDDLRALISPKVQVSQKMIMPFTELCSVMVELLKLSYRSGSRFISDGLAAPEIEMAAHRAEIEHVPAVAPSPFAGDTGTILQAVTSKNDILYISNPGRTTGSNFSLSELKDLARAVPDGLLIIDEQYFDYFGISSMPLLELFNNVVVFRSFTASFGIYSSDAGFLVTSPERIEQLKPMLRSERISLTVRKTILATLVNDEALAARLHEVHEESLRLATTLTSLGAQVRITATDFLLIRVADPQAVSHHLDRHKVPIEHLVAYPRLKEYLRYRIQSPISNDRFLSELKKVAPELLKGTSFDRSTIRMNRKGEVATRKKAPRRIPALAARTGDHSGFPGANRKKTEKVR